MKKLTKIEKFTTTLKWQFRVAVFKESFSMHFRSLKHSIYAFVGGFLGIIWNTLKIVGFPLVFTIFPIVAFFQMSDKQAHQLREVLKAEANKESGENETEQEGKEK